MIESLLLTASYARTFERQRPPTIASGFFFQGEERPFLVMSRHFADRIKIELHVDPDNLGVSTGFSIPLYSGGKSVWHQRLDTTGEIDIAVIEIECTALPATTVFSTFTQNRLPGQYDQIEVDTSLLVVGFAREQKVVVISCLIRDIASTPGQYSRRACIGTNFSEVLS